MATLTFILSLSKGEDKGEGVSGVKPLIIFKRQKLLLRIKKKGEDYGIT